MTYHIIVDGLLSEFAKGEAVLLNLTHKRYHVFNETGAFIWTLLEKGPTGEADLAATIGARYDLGLERAHATVLRFIAELSTLGLVEALPE